MPRVLGAWGGHHQTPSGAESDVVLLFEPRDCWVGWYWDESYVYLTLIPCLPVRFTRVKPESLPWPARQEGHCPDG